MSGYLTMYNVKSIQPFIFNSNKVKEIIGASNIVETVVLDTLTETVYKICEKERELRVLLKEDIYENGKALPFRFLDDETIGVELVYEGGGNIVVAYKDKEMMDRINHLFSTSLLLKAKGIHLITASVEMSDNYSNDNANLRKQLNDVTCNIQPMAEVLNLPVTIEDAVTGEPLSKKIEMHGVSRHVSLSRYQKIKTYEELNERYPNRYLPDEGRIAIVHADGNNMGIAIRKALEGVTDYKEAVKRIRIISMNVATHFNKAFENAIEYTKENYYPKEKWKKDFVRPIILAGDDVTYTMIGEYAMAFTERFLQEVEHLSTEDHEGNMMEGLDLDPCCYRACAGIVYCHAHYPFKEGYELAESLCSSAKKFVKKKENRRDESGNRDTNGKAQSSIDFHICLSGIAHDIDTIRERQYVNARNISLLRRPYVVTEGVGIKPTMKDFKEAYEQLKQYPHSKQKKLRDLYYKSKEVASVELHAMNSRFTKQDELVQPEDLYIKENGETIAKYYDVLEIYDLLAKKQVDGGKTDE